MREETPRVWICSRGRASDETLARRTGLTAAGMRSIDG